MRRTVGILGVGKLGLAVAQRLLASGYTVLGYRRTALDAFSALGGQAMPSSAALAASGTPLILLLPADAALDEQTLAIIESLSPEQLVMCLGTHSIPAKQAARRRIEAAGARFVEGEVSGTPDMTRSGAATVMIAGDHSTFESARPILEGFARAVTYVGEFGNATRMKLVTNYLVGVHTLAAAEALVMARALNLDPELTVRTIAQSAGGSAMLAVRGPMMAARSYGPGSIADYTRVFEPLRRALNEGGIKGGALLDLTESLYLNACAEGFAGHDIAAIHESLLKVSP